MSATLLTQEPILPNQIYIIDEMRTPNTDWPKPVSGTIGTTPVRNSQLLDASVDWEDIGHMAIVEPEPGGVHQNSPVVGVVCEEAGWDLKQV